MQRLISWYILFFITVFQSSVLVSSPATMTGQAVGVESVYRAAASLDVAALQRLQPVINSKGAKGWTALHRSAYEGLFANVEILLENGAQADSVDDAGRTPRDYALFGKHLKVAELLSSQQGLPQTANSENELVQAIDAQERYAIAEIIEERFGRLRLAVEAQDQRAIADLVARGEDTSGVDSKGRTLMHIAVENNSLAAVLALLDAGIDLFHLDNDGKLAFDLAAERGYALIASYLLEAMAGVRIKDPKGWPTLNWAVVSGDLRRVDCLLERGAKVGNGCQNALEVAILMARDVSKDKIFKRLLAVEGIDAASRRGDTGLMSASRRGDVRVVDIFLEHGADVNVADLWHGFTILRIASEEGHIDIVNRLLAKNADARATDNLGETPLHRAAARGHLDVVKALIPVSDVNAKNIGGITPLLWASKGGHVEVMVELLNAGATIHDVQYGRVLDPSEADVNKLFAALTNAEQDIEQVRTALDRYARPDALNSDREWALSVAVKIGFTAAVELLLAYGAAPDLVSADGMTPLQHAMLLQRKDEAKALLRYGADPNFPSKQAKSPLPSPLVLAAKKDLLEMAEIVLYEVGGVSKETMLEALEAAKARGNDHIVKSITKALEGI